MGHRILILVVVASALCLCCVLCDNVDKDNKKENAKEDNEEENFERMRRQEQEEPGFFEAQIVDIATEETPPEEREYSVVMPDDQAPRGREKTAASPDHARPKAPKSSRPKAPKSGNRGPAQAVTPPADTETYHQVVAKARDYRRDRKHPHETTTEAIAAAKLYSIPLDSLEVNLAFSRRRRLYSTLAEGFSDPVDYSSADDVANVAEAYAEKKDDGSVVTVLLSKPTDTGIITVKIFTQKVTEDGVSTSYVKFSELHTELAVDVTKEPQAKSELIGEYSLEPALKTKKLISLTEEQQLLENLFLMAQELLSSPKAVSQFKGYEKMMSAADKGHPEASVIVATQRLFGSQFLKENPVQGIDNLRKLADKGIASAQRNLAFVYASGLLINSSQSKALVYFTFSALGDDAQSQMALGYRYWAGIGVEAKCDTALEHYRTAAMKVALESELSHKSNTPMTRIRLQDEDTNGATAAGMLDDDLIQYYQFLADKGDINAMVGLGQLYFQGARGVAIDFKLAHHYFSSAATQGNANANAYLGKLYLEGNDHFPANNQTAFNYYTLAEQKDSSIGQHGLGLMYLRGSGVTKDLYKAFLYFSKSAGQGHSDAQYKLATMYYHGITGGRTDFKLAVKWFKTAAQAGHLLAMYELGKMHAVGIGVMRSCYTATELFKNVAERGSWAEQFALAHKLYRNLNHKKQAFYIYSTLAELGYEVAQSNVAYILDKGADFLETLNEHDRYRRSLQQLSRAATQGNTMARLRIGDYHYFGLGTGVDYMAAVSQYRLASDVPLKNAQAMFNLAYMFEMGLGTKQDMHLAKRFYDMSIDSSEDAYVPVTMALLKLSTKFFVEAALKGTLLDLVIPESFTIQNIYTMFGVNWDLYIGTVLALLLGALIVIRQQRRAHP